ncbi:FAD-dependent oxidoreductase [Taibaiella sp. KBW10]|uniref:NAD(P)/FAD-dependent oxidoreductase n=1 Tax=Taibaiella sp. KBW10 TaxID=2153357 RepID=UPI000F5B7099|nr:FAD-dependent oxidoreductase [Taibaiella sp. KBW10]RQO30016.1 FAD-dependent oxidoreductase [Taibaiella sp. KBW10]
MISFWERESLFQYDFIIVGSGIVGLNTAINLKIKYPRKSVLVLERAPLPTGASTRNAGFACMGSLSELSEDLKSLSESELVTLFMQRKQGIDLLRKRLGDDRIGYRANGSHELLTASEAPLLTQLDYFNQLLKEVSDTPVFKIKNEAIRDFGVAAHHFKYCVETTCEGELHTGKMMRSLIDFAIEKGVEIKTGVMVQHFEEHSHSVKVYTSDPYRKDALVFSAAQLCICTNAFTPHFFPELDIQPGRGQVIITKPVPGLKLKGIYHFDQGYYYFREIEGRVLFGGGRNLDFEKETTTRIETNEAIVAHLTSLLQTVILPEQAFEIEMQWAGIMAFGASKKPILQSFSPRVHGAFRLGGMGVALGSLLAQQLADLTEI